MDLLVYWITVQELCFAGLAEIVLRSNKMALSEIFLDS